MLLGLAGKGRIVGKGLITPVDYTDVYQRVILRSAFPITGVRYLSWVEPTSPKIIGGAVPTEHTATAKVKIIEER
jgi:hypothetical protein